MKFKAGDIVSFQALVAEDKVDTIQGRVGGGAVTMGVEKYTVQLSGRSPRTLLIEGSKLTGVTEEGPNVKARRPAKVTSNAA